MHEKTLKKRLIDRIEKAKSDVLSHGMVVRKAARKYHIPKSTLQDAIQRQRKGIALKKRQGRRAFNVQEEEVIVKTLEQFADHGIPLTRQQAKDVIALFVSNMSAERRHVLPFVNGIPGNHFLRGFYSRHKERLKFGVPTRQEGRRWASANAETITTHFSRVELIVEKYNIDANRLWNLDETGATPGIDTTGASRRKRFTRRNGASDYRLADFSRCSRASMLACISASGQAGPPLFVFKGAKLPFRDVLTKDGRVITETYATHLPRHSCVAVREEVGGIDAHNFFAWAHHFVESTRDLTANGRKVLLFYDAHRAHMSVRVLQLLLNNGIIAYALPAHTSSVLQPCDLVVFSKFKTELNKAISDLVIPGLYTSIDMFQICTAMRTAYNAAFTYINIVASFRRSGLWPLDATRFLKSPLPKDHDAIDVIVSSNELFALMQSKREAARQNILGNDVTVAHCGFVDTTRGAVLNSEHALALAVQKSNNDREKRQQRDIAAIQKELRAARRAEKARQERERIRESILARRALLARRSVAEFKEGIRSMRARRAAARLRMAMRNRQHTSSALGTPLPSSQSQWQRTGGEQSNSQGSPLSLLASVTVDLMKQCS